MKKSLRYKPISDTKVFLLTESHRFVVTYSTKWQKNFAKSAQAAVKIISDNEILP
jgi:hypothetical protein